MISRISSLSFFQKIFINRALVLGLLQLFTCYNLHSIRTSFCTIIIFKVGVLLLWPSNSVFDEILYFLISLLSYFIYLAFFPTMLGSASSLTGCSWIPVFYMERLPIWPPQPSYWATRYLLVRLDVRLSGFWLSVTTVKDLRMTAGTNGFTCFPRHGTISIRPLKGTFERQLHNNSESSCPFQRVASYGEERARNSIHTLLKKIYILQYIVVTLIP